MTIYGYLRIRFLKIRGLLSDPVVTLYFRHRFMASSGQIKTSAAISFLSTTLRSINRDSTPSKDNQSY